MSMFWQWTVFSSLCTILGALPTLLFRNVSHRAKDMLLAYTAGIMVAASTYGLIPSALKLSNLYVLTAGILLGTVLLTVMELVIPHVDSDHAFPPREDRQSAHLLVMTAMLLHNLPEGLSTGVSLASGDRQLGQLVSVAIGLQNIPEGFLVALLMVTQRAKPSKALAYTFMIALTEWLASCLGYYFGTELRLLVPYGLSFAAGAMLYVVYKELIPESHGDGHEIPATFAFIVGTITMIALTHWLG